MSDLVCTACGRAGLRGFHFVDGLGARCVNEASCQARVAKAHRAANAGRCVDCVAEGVTTDRKPALDGQGDPRPGNRCVTHWRARKKVVSANAHAGRVESQYGITAAEYAALYEAQQGKCWICRFATGKTKRLAVDHDHETGMIRGLLCGRCNVMIGFLGRESLSRALAYLHQPPAIGVIGCRIVPLTGAPTLASMQLQAGVRPTTTDTGGPDP